MSAMKQPQKTSLSFDVDMRFACGCADGESALYVEAHGWR